MSVVVMTRDHPRFGAKGQRLTAVPFADANDLVRDGYAVRPGLSAIAAAPASVPAEALEAAGKRITELERSEARLTAEVADLRAEIETAAGLLTAARDEKAKAEAALAGLRAATAKK